MIAAPRERVWTALNNPVILARCIEGVESLVESTGDDGATRLDGKMNARVGPVRATFVGGVTLTEVDAPNRYVLVGEGKGGVAGFAKGSAEVRLSDADVAGVTGTRLDYAVTSSVGGKLAQLGARLIEGTARGYAETFFTRFKAEVETPDANTPVGDASAGDAPAVEMPVTSPQIEATATTPSSEVQSLHGTRARTGLTPLIWGTVLILIVIVVLIWEMR
ncbi:carbon monoxide dehydrogenase subunit G [Polymorphobacter sp. PAMC 29334]|uniref:CoxG family protein n=1 Tax=Polymorphobacter sp. PAMC 29334 TaxID=2862331 RepID=UPI001C7947B8|nr:carbon monoxide dehydrogenase subunit G [Polymorphobacter sp. PAMC 29334]QYE33732.1 carbon monoxide dehydrogenase subunit G [Polymorphobacter sp. PAMC 29334]